MKVDSTMSRDDSWGFQGTRAVKACSWTAPSIHQNRPLLKTRVQLGDAVGQVRWWWGNISVFFNCREHQNKKDSTQDLDGTTTRRCLQSIFLTVKQTLETKSCSWIPAREEAPGPNQKTVMLYKRKQGFICFHRSSHHKHENKPRKTDNLTLPLSVFHITRLEYANDLCWTIVTITDFKMSVWRHIEKKISVYSKFDQLDSSKQWRQTQDSATSANKHTNTSPVLAPVRHDSFTEKNTSTVSIHDYESNYNWLYTFISV